MVTKKALSEKVKALFALKVSGIASDLEAPGMRFFCGDSRLMDGEEVADISHEFESLIASLLSAKDPSDMNSAEFSAMKAFFSNLSHQVLMRGGHVEDVVRYTQTLQFSLIDALEKSSGVAFGQSRSVLLFFTGIFNELIMAVFGSYLEEREQTLQSQQAELRETATPITEIWDGVLTLPIIGTLDSNRTMLVMEALLNRISKDHAKAVVMDLTGVKSIDSQVSHHLIQMVRAVQLMGSDAIVTGIHPEIARALVSLNIDFNNITTRANMADGLKEAFRRMNITVSHV
ncbi:MAG TPA: STAS domain-containing protein [Gallionella sp.]|nr:STAS domain-containing protein [Gallionella sp.]